MANKETYFPPSESKGGWRYLTTAEDIRESGGIDPEKLQLIEERQHFLHGGDSWAIVIVHNGYLVKEVYTFNVLYHTRFDIFSATKTFTSMAFGLLLEASRRGQLPKAQGVELDSHAYPFIPEGYPLSDPRKERITIRHLLSMTTGIPGEDQGVVGMPVATGNGPFEHALGRCQNRYGKWADKLVAEPGTYWNYGDASFCHLSLVFANIMGEEMRDFMKDQVFDRIGIENLSWDVQGGSGFIGPHTNAHMGIHVSARELARFGYLLLRKGAWNGKQIIPPKWIELAATPSQELNPQYGLGIWVNRAKGIPKAPDDMFWMQGYRDNVCYIVPSLDLVVARVGTGPVGFNEGDLITRIVDAIQ